jgi:hypothetical protein
LKKKNKMLIAFYRGIWHLLEPWPMIEKMSLIDFHLNIKKPVYNVKQAFLKNKVKGLIGYDSILSLVTYL